MSVAQSGWVSPRLIVVGIATVIAVTFLFGNFMQGDDTFIRVQLQIRPDTEALLPAASRNPLQSSYIRDGSILNTTPQPKADSDSIEVPNDAEYVLVDYKPWGGMRGAWPASGNRTLADHLEACFTATMPDSADVNHDMLLALSTEPIIELELLHRVSFKVRLGNGMRAAFKVYGGEARDHSMDLADHVGWNDQGFSELAAFHLDRALGVNRTPMVVGRALPLNELIKVTPTPYHRYLERAAVTRADDGVRVVRGGLVEWSALSSPRGITDEQLEELKVLRKSVMEKGHVEATGGDAQAVTVPQRMINTLAAFDLLILNFDRVKRENFFLRCPPSIEYTATAKLADLLNAGCTFVHLDNGLGFYDPACEEGVEPHAEDYLRKYQEPHSRLNRLLYVGRPFRNCEVEEALVSNIRQLRDTLGQRVLASLQCDPMGEFGPIMQYWDKQCYIDGLNRRAAFLAELADMCDGSHSEALIPLVS